MRAIRYLGDDSYSKFIEPMSYLCRISLRCCSYYAPENDSRARLRWRRAGLRSRPLIPRPLAVCICIFIFIANERHGTFVLCLRIIDGCPFAFASDKNSCLLISFILRASLTHREKIVGMKVRGITGRGDCLQNKEIDTCVFPLQIPVPASVLLTKDYYEYFI